MASKLKIIKKGVRYSFFQDLYYKVIKASWSKFMLASAFFYLFLNFLFACLYYFSPAEILNVRPDSLWDAFTFSFQTSSTVGYGHFLPKSDLAHALVIMDTMVGIFYVAIITGLAFSKFALPSSKIRFTEKVILSTFDERPCLMFRIANDRDSNIVDTTLHVAALLPYTSKEGHHLRRFYDLNLLTSYNPSFSLTWTAIHIIDEDSPLFGRSYDDFLKDQLIITASITGIDAVLSQTIHANKKYTSENIKKAKKFADILHNQDLNNFVVDYSKFNIIEE